MKGPRSRHRHNVHRIWECPRCKTRVFEPARVTCRVCNCEGPDRPTWMQLIELPPPWRKPADTPPATPPSSDPLAGAAG